MLDDLLALVSHGERGDPMSPLRWTCKSLRKLAAILTALAAMAYMAIWAAMSGGGFGSIRVCMRVCQSERQGRSRWS